MPEDNEGLTPDTPDQDDYDESETTEVVPDSHMSKGTEEDNGD